MKAEVLTQWVNASTRWVCVGGADEIKRVRA
jgi:hypothetical protein